MAAIKEITTMCKNGQVKEAYELAKADLVQNQPWSQREMGWVLYYMIKADTDTANFQSLLSHLEELNTLDQLTTSTDNMIFENVLYQVAQFVKSKILPSDLDSPSKLSQLFSKLRHRNYISSNWYSFLLHNFIKHDKWLELADFIEWWDLDKLTNDDYLVFKANQGKIFMSLAEQAFIAYSKVLLRLNDLDRIESFLPRLDKLMNTHPEMTYPGYFYGKLLLALGNTQEEALKAVRPFARKKVSQFWVWQVISEMFCDEPKKQLACLLRAVHCGAQESFLGKVRTKIASLYIQKNQYGLAKFHIEKVAQCYYKQGWHLPDEVKCWIHQPWFNMTEAVEESSIDFMSITQDILYDNVMEAIAIVVKISKTTEKVVMVYDKGKYISQKLTFKAEVGTALSIKYVLDPSDKPKRIDAKKTRLTASVNFAKEVKGTVQKMNDKGFAFLKTKKGSFYMSPQLVCKYSLQNNDNVTSLVVYAYNTKEKVWNWRCVSSRKTDS